MKRVDEAATPAPRGSGGKRVSWPKRCDSLWEAFRVPQWATPRPLSARSRPPSTSDRQKRCSANGAWTWRSTAALGRVHGVDRFRATPDVTDTTSRAAEKRRHASSLLWACVKLNFSAQISVAFMWWKRRSASIKWRIEDQS